MQKVNEELIQIVKEHPERGREVLEQLRDSVDEKRKEYIDAASKYAEKYRAHYERWLSALEVLRSQIQKCRNVKDEAVKLRPVAALTDKVHQARNEQVISDMSDKLIALKREEKAALAKVITGGANYYALAEKADRALTEALDVARFTRFQIADMLEDEIAKLREELRVAEDYESSEALENRIEQLREELKMATDGIPQRVVVPATLTFVRLRDQHKGAYTLEQLIEVEKADRAVEDAKKEADRRKRELFPGLKNPTE